MTKKIVNCSGCQTTLEFEEEYDGQSRDLALAEFESINPGEPLPTGDPTLCTACAIERDYQKEIGNG